MTFTQKIDDDLTLRSLQDETDKVDYATFNGVYNMPEEGKTCACLLNYHPEMTLDDFWIVESHAAREIVSTTCLIPWHLRFAGLHLRAAQLEMVLTHPDYRSRGLVRKQIARYEQAASERGYDLNIIWGIPYYYRQFGYSYTIEGGTVESLPVWQIPADGIGVDPSIRLRPVGVADIPMLTELYDCTSDALDLSTRRTPDYWRYLIETARHPVEIVERAEAGDALGYAVIQRSQKMLTVLENALPDAETALALLQLLKPDAVEIRISWPVNTPLATLACQLGSRTVPGGQWLVRIPDMASFLRKMGPLFEQRLAASDWHGLSAQITINLFRQAMGLHFEKGRLIAVDALGFVDASMGADGGHLCIPPDAFLRLIFGHRCLDELFDAWPDITVKAEARALINTLFPRLAPFLSTPYFYLGELDKSTTPTIPENCQDPASALDRD